MGSALIQGWDSAGLLKRADIMDPSGIPDSLTSQKNLFHVKHTADIDLQGTDVLILAVKPQIMGLICDGLKEIFPENAHETPPVLSFPILSIAAGKSTAYFQERFSKETPIIRAMPNTPAAIGQGISALYATQAVTDDQKQMADELLAAAGQTLWIEEEEQMDAVTAVSGSGPAYVFYLIEAMAHAGEKAGLSAEQAMQLARQTVIGSAALAAHEETTPASMLRRNVTSPGGTTEAALEILMDGRLQDIMDEAIETATTRGQELSD